jgi:hypothetical protein
VQSHTPAGDRGPGRTHQAGTVFGLRLLEMDNHPMEVVIEARRHEAKQKSRGKRRNG